MTAAATTTTEVHADASPQTPHVPTDAPNAALIGPHVEVIYPDGRTEQYPITGEKVTVGSGPAADISLPDASDLEPLHLLLAPRSDGCWISTSRTALQEAKHEGRLFENGVVDWGFELDIASLTFRVTNTKAGNHASAVRKRRIRKMLMLGALAALVMFALREPDRSIARTSAEAPALFDDLPNACEARGVEARSLATQLLNAADARAERYPFEPNDGVRAVFSFTEASLCFRAAGDGETADWVLKERDKIRKRIEENYLFHRIRLERALDNERYRDALHEERLVAALVRGRGGEYVEWLTQVDRILEIRARSEKKR